MISLVLTASGSGIDNAKFILMSFVLHILLVLAFWRGNEQNTQIALPMSISLSNVAIEEKAPSKAKPVEQKQQPKKQESKPVVKINSQNPIATPKPIETQARTQSEPTKQEKAAVSSDAKADVKKIEEPRQEKEVPASFTADYLNNPTPPYPSISRRLGEEGTTYLKVHVMPDGSAAAVLLHKSSGFARLDECALNAVKKWRFAPAKKGNTVIASWVNVPVDFKLAKGA